MSYEDFVSKRNITTFYRQRYTYTKMEMQKKKYFCYSHWLRFLRRKLVTLKSIQIRWEKRDDDESRHETFLLLRLYIVDRVNKWKRRWAAKKKLKNCMKHNSNIKNVLIEIFRTMSRCRARNWSLTIGSVCCCFHKLKSLLIRWDCVFSPRVELLFCL